MREKIAENLITLRNRDRLSQEQLAEKIGVSRQAVSNWERGIATPDLDTLELISKLFNVDLSDIINGGSNPQKTSKDTTPYRTILLISSVLLMVVHFVFAFLDKIDFFPVVLIPGVLVSISVLIHFVFRHTIAQNDLSIIAGYDKKKDNAEMVKKQLATIDLLNLAVVVFFNTLFFIMYAAPRSGQLFGSLVFFGAYILTFAAIVVCVNLKIKSR